MVNDDQVVDDGGGEVTLGVEQESAAPQHVAVSAGWTE